MYGKGLLKGLGITLGYHMKKKITTQYPEQRPNLPPRFRGCLEYDMDKCFSCNACVKACPNDVLELVTSKGADGKRKPARFTIDLQYCMFCNFCVEVCTKDALSFSPNFELACFGREQSKRVYEAPIIEIAPAAEAEPAADEAVAALAKKQEVVGRFADLVAKLKKELQDENLVGEERQQKEERLAKLNTALAMAKRELKQLKPEPEPVSVNETASSKTQEQQTTATKDTVKKLVAQIKELKQEMQSDTLTEDERAAKNEQLKHLSATLKKASAELNSSKTG